MSLYEQVISDLTEAMRNKDAEKLSALRMVKAALLNVMKEGKGKDNLTDEQVIAVLNKEAKKRKESAQAYRDARRVELAEKEEKELVMIKTYLPEQLSDDGIRSVVKQVIEELGTDNFGAVMGATMKKLQGQADGKIVKQIVQESLT